MIRRRSRGFTLLEALVAIALLALLAGLLTGALRFGLVSTRQVEARIAGLEDLRAAQHFLRRQIEAAVPLIVNDETRGEVAFRGGPGRLDLVAEMYGRDGMPGLWYLRIAVQESETGSRLIVLRQPITREREPFRFLPDADAAPLALVHAPLAISYHDGRRWLESWPRSDTLPRLVRIRAGDGDRADWPDLLAVPRLGVVQQ
ncbi:MAG: prepilin-type N-terminal cleavage/methylation domain-containing protein [Alphaproteobacteria bacterium]|nr:prepilin-type N-terminal cleavage/methylation domain-containing protein [Alphaproteobacteria bacterium]